MADTKITTVTQLKSSLVQSKIYVLNQITNVIEAVDVELSEIRSLINGNSSTISLESEGKIMLAELSPYNIEGAFWYDYYEEYNDPKKIPCLKLRHKDYDYIYKYDSYRDEDTELLNTASDTTVSILGTDAGNENGSFWYELDEEDMPILFFYKDGYSYGIKHDYADYKGIADKTHLVFYAPYDVDLQDACGNLIESIAGKIIHTSTYSVKGGAAIFKKESKVVYNLKNELGDEDFTISFYAYKGNGYSIIRIIGSIDQFFISANAIEKKVRLYYLCEKVYDVSNTYVDVLTLDTFCHFAMVYEHNNKRLLGFCNGKMVCKIDDVNIVKTPRDLRVETDNGNANDCIFDELKIYNGIALYKTNFIPPLQYYTPIYPNGIVNYLYNDTYYVFAAYGNFEVATVYQKDILYKNHYCMYADSANDRSYNKRLSYYSSSTVKLTDQDVKWTFEYFVYVKQQGSPILVIGSRSYDWRCFSILELTSEGLTIYASNHSKENPNYVIHDTNPIELVPSLDKWYHIAFVKDSGTFYYFTNGKLIRSWSNYTYTSYNACDNNDYTISLYSINPAVFIGAARGWEGIALYTSDFTPPTDF